MDITILAASSVDGRLTNNSQAPDRSWISPEDLDHFYESIADHNLVVMGRKTYQVMRPVSRNKRLYVVLTRSPDKYSDRQRPGKKEFSNETPEALVKRLTAEGYTKMLIIGGGDINAVFINAGLVNLLYITIEPYLFGDGIELLGGVPATAALHLEEHSRLNDKGTLLLKYRVQKN